MAEAWRSALLALLATLSSPARGTLDTEAAAMLHPARDETLHPEALVRRLALLPSAIVADIGSGPGRLTLPLARAVPQGRVIATDIRADYLAIAAARAAAGRLSNVETRVVPPDRPGLDAGSIDLVFM